MGSIMGMAFADVIEKTDIIRERNSQYKDKCKGGLQSIILHEMSLNIHEMNGENN
jgi:hypothetical protein